MKAEEYNAALVEVRRLTQRLGAAIVVGSAGAGLAVGYVWSFVCGIPLSVILALAGFEAKRRITKRFWIVRFPELRRPSTVWRYRIYDRR